MIIDDLKMLAGCVLLNIGGKKMLYKRLEYGKLLKVKDLKKITAKGAILFAIESLGMHKERKGEK
ncbi:hypothetical protein [Megamonas funiformis]|uniref:hypothetical protein n=1 Tax=Megamonas funiformis TaxID=437897 RepID=UPI0039903E21